jgi:hypothetical protein
MDRVGDHGCVRQHLLWDSPFDSTGRGLCRAVSAATCSPVPAGPRQRPHLPDDLLRAVPCNLARAPCEQAPQSLQLPLGTALSAAVAALHGSSSPASAGFQAGVLPCVHGCADSLASTAVHRPSSARPPASRASSLATAHGRLCSRNSLRIHPLAAASLPRRTEPAAPLHRLRLLPATPSSSLRRPSQGQPTSRACARRHCSAQLVAACILESL